MKAYWKITLWYLAFGVVWICVSDRVTAAFLDEEISLSYLQTLKGLAYVFGSSVLIFLLMRAAFKRQTQQEIEKLSVFKKTVEGSQHILLNYLNQIQLVTLEAETCADFDKSILTCSKLALEEASSALRRLDAITVVTPEEINAALYSKRWVPRRGS